MKRRRPVKRAAKERVVTEVDLRFAPVVRTFAADRLVTHGKMMAACGLKVNGKIFAMFGRDKFDTKLPKKRVDELVKARIGERFDPGHGRLMKEWIAIASEEANWIELAREAYEFVKHNK